MNCNRIKLLLVVTILGFAFLSSELRAAQRRPDTEAVKSLLMTCQHQSLERRVLVNDVLLALEDITRSTPISDALNFEFLKSIDPLHFVSILAGNSYQRPSADQKLEIARQVINALNSGKIILYSADNLFAPFIEKISGDRGIGISGGKPLSKGNHLVISNDHMRLLAFSHSRQKIMTPNSIGGLALLVFRDTVYPGPQYQIIYEGSLRSKDRISEWMRSRAVKDRKLGITPVEHAEFIPNSLLKPMPDVQSFGPHSFSTALPRSIRDLVERAPSEVLNWALAYASDISNAEAAIKKILKGQSGVSMMGSGSIDPVSTPLIEEFGKQMGFLSIPVTSGGAGGSMETVARGVVARRGIALGIPVTGRHTPALEQGDFKKGYSASIGVKSYPTRIQLLIGAISGLGEKQIVAYAPGGSGTARELATHLMMLEAFPESPSQILFLDSEYYGGLATAFKQRHLPLAFRRRIHIADNTQEIAAILKALLAENRILWNRLSSGESPFRTRSTPE